MFDRPGRLETSDAQLRAQAGADWARHRALPSHLDGVAKFVAEDLEVFSAGDSGHQVAAGLFQVVHGRLNVTESELAHMLGVDDDALVDVTFEDVRGFIYGALQARGALGDKEPAT